MSSKSCSVLFGTPAPFQMVLRKVDGLVMPLVYGFFTVIGPEAKLSGTGLQPHQ